MPIKKEKKGKYRTINKNLNETNNFPFIFI